MMKKIMTILVIIILSFVLIFRGCIEEQVGDKSDVEDETANVMGTLRLQITDDPGDLDIIYANVTISMVQVHKSEADDDEEEEDDDGEEDNDDEGFIATADGEYVGSVGILIQFSGNASGGDAPYNWTWDFGDGNGSYIQNPQHAYMAEGEYDVNLTVVDNSSAIVWDTTKAMVVDEDEYDDGFIADAGGNYKGFIDELIRFEGNASGGTTPYNWSWDFGDGNHSFEQNPQHSYDLVGEYQMNLTVTDSINATDWDNATVTIEEEGSDDEEDDSQSGWFTIANKSQTFDLIALQNVTDVLGEKVLATGKYTQIRLTVEKAIITVNNSAEIEIHELKIPSDKVKLIKSFWIYENDTTILTLDFDVHESVHKTGSNKYIMKPTIKIIQE
jgi:PKD repeat protein